MCLSGCIFGGNDVLRVDLEVAAWLTEQFLGRSLSFGHKASKEGGA